jgi:hypothetical protein
MFSYIMGYFTEKMESFSLLHKDFNEGEELTKFLKTLCHFNMKQPINMEFESSKRILKTILTIDGPMTKT